MVDRSVMPEIDHILVDRAPGQTRILLCAGDPAAHGAVVETLFDRCDFRNLTGSVHRVRLSMGHKVQNRAMASLADGTAVSVRLGKRDNVGDGDLATITIMAAPRDGKPWQAAMGARLSSNTLILLPDQSGVSTSRHLPAAASDRLIQLVTARLQAETENYGVILRRDAANAEEPALMAELDTLLADWSKRDDMSGVACLFDGGDLVERAKRMAPDAKLVETIDPDSASRFEDTWDEAMELATRPDVHLPDGGIIWIEPTRAVVALDLDGASGSIDALLRDAPQAIAAQLRLRAIGGLVAIDVPRAAPAAMRQFSTKLAAALADDPRHPEQLGRTNGGLLELRLPHGGPGPTDYIRNHDAGAALAALRNILWRPQLARPHLYASQSVIDWLRGPGSQALADLAAHLDRQIVLGVSSQGLVIRDGPADVPG